VEAVKGLGESARPSTISGGIRHEQEGVFTRGVEWDRNDKRLVGSNFHFSLAPTVTTSFIAFAFDIRDYPK
jgi:hypothetical protein